MTTINAPTEGTEQFHFVDRITQRATTSFPVLASWFGKASSVLLDLPGAATAVSEAKKLSRAVEPQLKQLDTLGCRGLDVVESSAHVAYEKSQGLATKAVATAHAPAEALKTKVEGAKASLAPKVAAYVDVGKLPALNDVLRHPLDETLATLERFVPEETEETSPVGSAAAGAGRVGAAVPSYTARAVRLTTRASKQFSRVAYGKLENLTLRSAERVSGIIHVNLIEYASGARDATKALANKATQLPARATKAAKDFIPKNVQATATAAVAALPIAPYKSTGHVVRDVLAWATASVPIVKERVASLGLPIAAYKRTGHPVRDTASWATESATLFMLFVQSTLLRMLPEGEPTSPVSSKDDKEEGTAAFESKDSKDEDSKDDARTQASRANVMRRTARAADTDA